MGPAMEVEKRFFNALRSVRRYEIRDRRLLLFDENDTRVLLFATDEASGENAPG
jgi:heat shock protein HslJ